MFAKARNIYHEFPRTFWVLVGATFIDQIGAALIFPFLMYVFITSANSARSPYPSQQTRAGSP